MNHLTTINVGEVHISSELIQSTKYSPYYVSIRILTIGSHCFPHRELNYWWSSKSFNLSKTLDKY